MSFKCVDRTIQVQAGRILNKIYFIFHIAGPLPTPPPPPPPRPCQAGPPVPVWRPKPAPPPFKNHAPTPVDWALADRRGIILDDVNLGTGCVR